MARATWLGLGLLLGACAPEAAAPPAASPAPPPVVAPPPPPAALPFRLPCGDEDFEGCKKGCEEQGRGASPHEDEGQREDCVTLATMLLKGKSTTADPPRAVGMLQAACDAKSARGCMRLGDAMRDGAASGGDHEAANMYEKACTLGANLGCVAAGRAYVNGRGVDPDHALAADLFARVCSRGNADACLELGHLYRRGDGVKPSTTKAVELFDRACKLGLEEGCVNASKDGSASSPRD